VPKFKLSLLDYSHYIDHVLGVWTHHLDPDTGSQNFLAFQVLMNCFGKLKWELTSLKKEVDYMDFTLQVIQISIFEKPTQLVSQYSTALGSRTRHPMRPGH
jgi:hypothetical protein